MNRRCDKIIVLGRLCGDALFLFAERSMPVPYICDPGHKKRTRTQARPHVFYSTIDKYHVRQFGSGHCPAKKRRTTTAARPHVFYSTADKHHVRQFGSGHCPAKKRRTTTAARPHEFYSTSVYLHPTTVCPRRLAAENDPWRFRQQSSRVISIQFWYLTSWLPRFL